MTESTSFQEIMSQSKRMALKMVCGIVVWSALEVSANEIGASSRQQVGSDAPQSRPGITQLNWGFASEGFQVSVSFTKEEFTLEEPVQAVLVTRNVSDRTLSYNIGTSQFVRFLVVNEAGERVPTRSETNLPPGRRIVTSGKHRRLMPGGEGEETFDLRKLFDLGPGNYTVSISRMVPAIDDPYARQAEVLSGNATLRIIASSAAHDGQKENVLRDPHKGPKANVLTDPDGSPQASRHNLVGATPQNPKLPSTAPAQDNHISDVAEPGPKTGPSRTSGQSSSPAATTMLPMSDSPNLLYGFGILGAALTAGLAGFLLWRKHHAGNEH